MTTDQQGMPLTAASPSGAAAYRSALDQFLRFKPTVFASLDETIGAHPGFALPYVAKAYLGCFLTEPGGAAEARATLAEMRRRCDVGSLSAREQGHVAAADAWARGGLREAARILDRVLLDSPRDALALRIGHELDFFVGDTANLRDRVERALSAWSAADPHHGFMLACHAFGLEENGRYEQAEEVGRRAVEIHGDDVWGIHAVAHSFEMRGLLAEGLRFMDGTAAGWAADNLFVVHNWWHGALYRVDLGEPAKALEIFDQALWNEANPKIALVFLDGSSLLWRLHLEGVDVAERWRALADGWAAVLDEPHYAFNDMHATMAYVGAGRQAEAEARVARLERYLESASAEVDNQAMTARVGLPVCRAIAAYGRGDDATAIAELWAARTRSREFGGSHAQRDVVDRTLLAAAIRSRELGLARALVSERCQRRPASPSPWTAARRLAEAAGDPAGAEEAQAREAELRAAIRARLAA